MGSERTVDAIAAWTFIVWPWLVLLLIGLDKLGTWRARRRWEAHVVAAFVVANFEVDDDGLYARRGGRGRLARVREGG